MKMTGASIEESDENGEAQFVVFQIGNEEFGIDIAHVREIIKVPPITKMPSTPSFIEGVLNLRGMITTVMDLRKRLDIEGTDSELARIIIVEIEDASIGLVVDSVAEVLRLSQAEVEPTCYNFLNKFEDDATNGYDKWLFLVLTRTNTFGI